MFFGEESGDSAGLMTLIVSPEASYVYEMTSSRLVPSISVRSFSLKTLPLRRLLRRAIGFRIPPFHTYDVVFIGLALSLPLPKIVAVIIIRVSFSSSNSDPI